MAITSGTSEVDTSYEYAANLDAQDSLKHIREEFIIPSRSDLKSKTLPEHSKQPMQLSFIRLVRNPANTNFRSQDTKRGIS